MLDSTRTNRRWETYFHDSYCMYGNGETCTLDESHAAIGVARLYPHRSHF